VHQAHRCQKGCGSSRPYSGCANDTNTWLLFSEFSRKYHRSHMKLLVQLKKLIKHRMHGHKRSVSKIIPQLLCTSQHPQKNALPSLLAFLPRFTVSQPLPHLYSWVLLSFSSVLLPYTEGNIMAKCSTHGCNHLAFQVQTFHHHPHYHRPH
jgi:hypothetical protein